MKEFKESATFEVTVIKRGKSHTKQERKVNRKHITNEGNQEKNNMPFNTKIMI
jgi:hypothetical protein